MSLQPGSSYVNYLAVKKLLPLDDYANQYPSTTIFAVDSSGTLAGYSPDVWFSTIGMPNPSTLQSEIISTIGIINSALGSTTYGLVSSMDIVNKDVLTSSLTSTVGGLAATTGVSQAQLDSVIKNLGMIGYVSSTQLASTVAGLGTAGYLSTGADGLLSVRALSTGSVALSTLALVDTADPAQAKLLYNKNGGLFFGASQLGGTITDLSLNTLDVSNATVYQNLTVGGSVYVPYGLILAPNVYSDTISTAVVNAQKDAIPRSWGVTGDFGDGTLGVQYSSDGGNTWDVSASLFDSTTGQINNLIYLNGIWFALGYKSIIGVGNRGILYTVDNGALWGDVLESIEYDLFDTDLYSIAYNGSTYLLVGQKGGISTIWSSADGITWSILSTPAIDTVLNITYNGTYWVICGSGGSKVQYSVDGISWSSASGFSGGSQFSQINYNGHTMIISDPYSTTNNLYYSEDKGITWVAVTIGSAVINSLSWNGTVFVASTSAPSIYTSRDGITWTLRYTPAEIITSIFWNGRVFKGAGTTYAYESTDGYTWSQTPKTYTVASPTAISYSVDVRDDLITTNARYYGVDIPHYYDSANQIYAGPDRLVLNDTLIIKNGLVGVMKGDPGVHLDIEGAARASTLMASTLQLADPLGQTVVTGRGGMMYINNIPIMQSTVAGLGQIYVSIPSLTSTVAGLGNAGYVSSVSLASTVAGLGTAGYVSSMSLASTVAGLGNAGYVSSASLASTVAGLGNAGYVSTLGLNESLTSTVAGLGTAGYVSTLGLNESLTLTVAGLGTAGYVSSMSLASTVAGLGTAGYVSTLGLNNSLTSTVAGLGTVGYVSTLGLTQIIINLGTTPGYISSPSLASTVGSLLTNLTVNSFSASTINYAKLYTSTVYVGNDNLSTNTIRFRGTNLDGGGGSGTYEHTVIGERIWGTPEKSELLLFKGNDSYVSGAEDRIRFFGAYHQFDVNYDDGAIWYENADPSIPQVPGALIIRPLNATSGAIGVNGVTPSYNLDVSGTARITGNVGIGTTSPGIGFRLDVSGGNLRVSNSTSSALNLDANTNENNRLSIIRQETANGNVDFFNRGTGVIGFTTDFDGYYGKFIMDASGRFGVNLGDLFPSYNLDVSGTARISNTLILGTNTAYACRAWVNFDASSGVINIIGQGNVSTVTRNNIGDFTINFASALQDANYVICGMSPSDSVTDGTTCVTLAADNATTGPVKTKTASAVRIIVASSNSAPEMIDGINISVAIFR
jgi:hypothetical protein